jgi:DNA-binding NarL/FixJ family response regulator
VKVLLADSSELIQKGLEYILESQDLISEFNSVTDSDDLLKSEHLRESDVLIIDFMSEGFTIDSVNQASAKMKNSNILAITEQQSALTIINALKAGVRSYVKKSCSVEEIIEAIESTGNSDPFFCGQIVEAIQAENINVEDISDKLFSCEPIKLSNRELEIIELIAEGYTNTQIADKLFLSAHTINTHRKNVMSKLGVNNTAAIVMYAVKTKLISPNKFLFNSV